jgi:hypothetical protein
MKKIKIMDQVTVYRDILSEEDIELFISEIKKSEQSTTGMDYAKPEDSSYFDYHGPQPQDRDDGSLIYTWTPWYTYGSRSIWSSPKSYLHTDKQSLGYQKIYDAIIKVHDDYVKEYKDSGKWTYDIADWNISVKEEDSTCLSTMEILKHRQNTDKKYTIAVHTDWHNHREDAPGPKQIITYTMYINDDYDGGEIDFADESNKHLIVYKPKRGDITAFPSGRPYWHGARGVTSENSKYFLRTFAQYRNPGSERYLNGLRVHGPVEWMKLEDERAAKSVESGTVGRQIVFSGQEPVGSDFPLYVDKETYIDGRNI